MSVVNNNLLLAAEDGGYVIDRSLRFRASASARLTRTPSTAGNRRTWTWSAWVKRGVLGSFNTVLSAGSNNFVMRYNVNGAAADGIEIYEYDGVNFVYQLGTVAQYRDPSAWYHVVFALDTTQATNTNRFKLYVNGVQVTSFSNTIYPSQNAQGTVNSTSSTTIGENAGFGSFLDGYLTEINFIDGQALTPTSFGEFDEDTGVWQPKKYAGSYGTNGFYLNFSNPASTTTIGADSSGNGNNWTSNNISVTAGATYDSMIDTPTPVADVRGNFCVANPLDKGANSVAASGNLDISSNNGTRQGIKGTFGVATGKWYFEYTKTTAASASVGVASAATTFAADSNVGSSATSWGYLTTGDKLNNNSSSAYGATWTTNDVIGVAFDMDAGTITFYKNNSSQGQAFSGLTGTVFPMGYNGSATADNFNFGQRPFAYTPPSGFKALHTGNLPEPAIVDGGEYFNAVLDTGANIKTASEAVYTHQLAWIKDRANANNHQLIDSVRGTSAVLQSNTTAAETTYSAPSGNSVAWVWSSPSTGVTNTAGSITSTVSAGVTQGFSVVSFNSGTAGNQTVGHGLGVTPSFIITKNRAATSSWAVWSSSFATPTQGYLLLNGTGDVVNDARQWANTAPTSTVFSFESGYSFPASSNIIAYCFAEVPGFSKFGSYTGNGSADGPFVFCGFRPRWVMFKRTDTTGDWVLLDTSRDTFNAAANMLFPNLSNAETNVGAIIDFLSNGFKLRFAGGASVNASGGAYIFAAFAENPFKNALAR